MEKTRLVGIAALAIMVGTAVRASAQIPETIANPAIIAEAELSSRGEWLGYPYAYYMKELYVLKDGEWRKAVEFSGMGWHYAVRESAPGNATYAPLQAFEQTPAGLPLIAAADFEKEVLQSDVPVLVDFWAEWCGPCRELAPELTSLESQFRGRARIVKINADESEEILKRYGITGLPTCIIFHRGQVHVRIEKRQSRNFYVSMLDIVLTLNAPDEQATPAVAAAK